MPKTPKLNLGTTFFRPLFMGQTTREFISAGLSLPGTGDYSLLLMEGVRMILDEQIAALRTSEEGQIRVLVRTKDLDPLFWQGTAEVVSLHFNRDWRLLSSVSGINPGIAAALLVEARQTEKWVLLTAFDDTATCYSTWLGSDQTDLRLKRQVHTAFRKVAGLLFDSFMETGQWYLEDDFPLEAPADVFQLTAPSLPPQPTVWARQQLSFF